MARRPKNQSVVVLLLGGLFILAAYVGLIYYLTMQSLAFGIIATIFVAGSIGTTVAGRFTRTGSVCTRVSQFYRDHALLAFGFLGLTGLGLGLGWNGIAELHETAKRAEVAERAAAAERTRQEARREAEEARRKEEAARFVAMDPDSHLAAARKALDNGYSMALGTGGDLDEAERHLRAIPSGVPQAQTATELLQTVGSRRAHALLIEARSAMAERGDIFARVEKAEQILQRVPAGVPEITEAASLRAQWAVLRDRAHLEAARKALGDKSFNVVEAHLDKIPPTSAEASAAKKLLLQSASERRLEEMRQEQVAARQRREEERAERAARSASRGLRCCDGSLSPSCSCGGSHRGCCSHHGGVCGCE